MKADRIDLTEWNDSDLSQETENIIRFLLALIDSLMGLDCGTGHQLLDETRMRLYMEAEAKIGVLMKVIGEMDRRWTDLTRKER